MAWYPRLASGSAAERQNRRLIDRGEGIHCREGCVRPIACHHCGAPIRSRDALAVAGHALRPLHAGCYDAFAAARPWYRKPSWPVNRWRSLLAFNALLLALHLAGASVAPERRAGLAAILLTANAWLLLARALSYWSLERHLPRHAAGRAPVDPAG